MPNTEGDLDISPEYRSIALNAIAREMYDVDSGLLHQADLIFAYGEAERFALGQIEDEPIGMHYGSHSLARCLTAVGASNLTSLPTWWNLKLDHILGPLRQEESKLWVEGMSYWIGRSLNFPPTPKDFDLIVSRLLELNLIEGKPDLDAIRQNVLGAWGKGYGYSPFYIARHLFKTGLVDIYGGEDLLQSLPNEADWLYLFHVLKLVTSCRLMDSGVRALGKTPMEMDSIVLPPWKDAYGKALPPFSQGLALARYVAHEARWIDAKFFVPDGERYEDQIV